MSYDPTRQGPPPQGPQQGYPQQGYPQQQPPAPAGGAPGSGALMQQLGRSGMVTAIAGLIVLIAFFLPWLTDSVPILGRSVSPSGFFIASNAGTISDAGGGSLGYLLWFVPLTALIMLGLPTLRAFNKVRSGLTSFLVLTTAILCFLFELLLIAGFSQAGQELGGTISTGFGLFLDLLALLVGFIAYFFFRSAMKKKYPKVKQAANAFAQPGQYPGQQPPYPRQ